MTITMEQIRKETEERIKKAAIQYKAMQRVRRVGKEQMTKIATNSELSRRFLAGSKLSQLLAHEEVVQKGRQQIQRIASNRLLRARFLQHCG